MKSFEIGYGDDKVIIHPKLVTVAESEDVQRKLNDITDTDTEKYQKEFEICRGALDAFSAKPAEKLVKEKGEYKRVPIEGGLTAHFATRTVESERIVREAYQIVMALQRPDSRFLS